MHSTTHTFAGFHMSREQADKFYRGVSYKMAMLGHLRGFRAPPTRTARDPKPLLLERLSNLFDGSPLPTRERSSRGIRKSALRLIGDRLVCFEREYREKTLPAERNPDLQKLYVMERTSGDEQYKLAMAILHPEEAE